MSEAHFERKNTEGTECTYSLAAGKNFGTKRLLLQGLRGGGDAFWRRSAAEAVGPEKHLFLCI
jgi:hypothetical protein